MKVNQHPLFESYSGKELKTTAPAGIYKNRSTHTNSYTIVLIRKIGESLGGGLFSSTEGRTVLMYIPESNILTVGTPRDTAKWVKIPAQINMDIKEFGQ